MGRSALTDRVYSHSQPRDPLSRDYDYPTKLPVDHPSYYISSQTSPITSKLPSRSPVSHSHAVGSMSPPSHPPVMASPSLRQAITSASTTNTQATAALHSPPPPSVLKAPVPPASVRTHCSNTSFDETDSHFSKQTPSRDIMSFSNILSNSEPEPRPRAPSPAAKVLEPIVKDERMDDAPVEKAERKKPARKPKRVSDLKSSETPSKGGRRASSHKDKDAPSPGPRVPVKRTANGQPKQQGGFSAGKEKKIKEKMDELDVDTAESEDIDLEEEQTAWQQRLQRRTRAIETLEAGSGALRRSHFKGHLDQHITLHMDLGKRRYDEMFYDEALGEVREQEVVAEKERKKDMQRKRRREKSMAVTIEQKEQALAKARAAELEGDEAERIKHMREAERANKKAQQTKLILDRGIKGPARNMPPLEINLEGGIMSTFPANDMEPSKPPKKGPKTGVRPKKSSEQKREEINRAKAAQAAIDAGQELPPKDEPKQIRIKINKKGPKEDLIGDQEGLDSKDSKDKDKVVQEPKDALETKFQSKGFNQIYDQIWRDLARKDVGKVYRLASDSYQIKTTNLKKTAVLASKEAKRWQLRTNKGTKDLQARAKRVMRDMMGFWKRNEREERDLRKAAEKQELENARKEEADREAARQKRKLNFLISQTELYSHFIGKKIKTHEVERSTDNPELATEESAPDPNAMDVDDDGGEASNAKVTKFDNLTFEEEDEDKLREIAKANAQHALAEAQQKARDFNKDDGLDEDGEMNFQNPTGMGEVEIEQPKMLNAQLKEYQLKGLNWLVNLYEQGINGILADEMGLGKTIQSISVMAYLAEKHDVWGPFLVVAPASTLHNWEQEIRKFVPEFKVLPYWGTAGDRKTLRKFWDRKHKTYKKDASFHVMVTSYQLVVSDVSYFQKMGWQYMILDEAQAIKSSQSSRWKCLLGFHCRNRLLLTGTPIQNNMQELWALLHFIMPSLFDSHDEFSEWFSKDIESHAQSNTKLNEDQLKRLHMILKPFMLRRVKKHVQKELGDKIELDVFCDLTYRQRAYYSNLRNQISIMDLIERATAGDDSDNGTLMNLVMQFRKVCNHPDLFERADTSSPFSVGYFAETASFVREGTNVSVAYSTRSLFDFELPNLVWRDGGRLHKAGSDNQKAGFRNKYLNHMMNIWTPDNIRESASGKDAFSWLRFADVSPTEAYKASHQDVFTRAVELAKKEDRLGLLNVVYDEPEDRDYTPAHALFQIHRRTDRKPLADVTGEGILNALMNVSKAAYDDTGLGRLEQAGRPRATAPPIDVSCNSRAANIERESTVFNVPMRRALYEPNPAETKNFILQKTPLDKIPKSGLLPSPDSEKRRFTNISVPSMRRFVTDSGKLAKLDELLFKLKEEGHRVLLYFQMTRMIDLMEEYLTYRNYKFCRLDGSTKLEDRRDTVHDFQTRPEIFIFLLSTRAGGLGINLTSADTVIFYDSDWNPTIDSQAMDRAHRLGQTRQVTVYRLITRGTIEERIRKRAMQKEEVQRVVISGGGTGAGVDFSGRRAPENRNKDIAMWLADDDDAVERMIEQREQEMAATGELEKKKKGGRRKKGEAVSLDDMYHEGKSAGVSPPPCSLQNLDTNFVSHFIGEGHFDDGNKASGTATPVEAAPAGKKKGKTSKKAKTAKQRLAIADGEVD